MIDATSGKSLLYSRYFYRLFKKINLKKIVWQISVLACCNPASYWHWSSMCKYYRIFNACMFVTMTLVMFCTSRATAEGAWVAAGQRGRPDHRPRPCQLHQDPGQKEGQEASRAGKVGTAPTGAAGSAVSARSGYDDHANLNQSTRPRGAAGVCVQRNSSVSRKPSRHDEQQQHKHCSRQLWETWLVSVCVVCNWHFSRVDLNLPKCNLHPSAFMHLKFGQTECFCLADKETVVICIKKRHNNGNWLLFFFLK